MSSLHVTDLGAAPLRVAPRVVPVRDSDLSADQVRGRRLERLSVLSGNADERFERITSLACTLFGVPMATVMLADTNSSRVSGSSGLSEAMRGQRSAAFSESVVSTGRPTVVEDATGDPRFAHLPSVTGAPYVRFFAGVPLADDENVVIGTFCLFDTVPRHLDHGQLTMLLQLASWARRELIDSSEMSRAREVQSGLLPGSTTVPPGWELAATCMPSKGVGGDFYDHAVLQGHLFLTLVDVMGKGVGAALVAATVRAVLRASATHHLQLARLTGVTRSSPLADIIAATDQLLQDDLGHTGTLVTGFGAVIEPRGGGLDWVDAGHGLGLVARADGSVERLTGGDMPVGIGLGTGWTQHHTTMAPGDTLLVVSDGLFDLLGGTSDSFDQIAQLAQDEPAPDALIARIVELTTLGTPLDDVTAIAIRRSSVAS